MLRDNEDNICTIRLAGAAKPVEPQRIPNLPTKLYRIIKDQHYRRHALRGLIKRDGQFQADNCTFYNRYPALFRFAQDHIGDGAALLSFGCSTGEEVFSLRKYFPRAHITGMDISRQNVTTCQAKLAASGDQHIAFVVGASTKRFETARFDAIFCLSVLRHGKLNRPGPARCDHLIRFADYEHSVTDFARSLKPGGLLFIANSNFRFADTAIAAAFDLVLREDLAGPDPRVPIFGRDNRLIVDGYCADLGFKKR